ncbi:dimethylallyl tryptophan synthase [Aspergillus nomiae NRRL 13137]|uniref:Dimethylallyl tryptophan synthase n=1 Tax=Aspergillus nomiae NRRL (strain ATCC 15546 / NRRL 13137 / CBS 260.88 / M93) TaxID=1509407 RepID=A0A0L1J1J2_ASPN3|nr:dimethylallyl tryptophan synthase [Aspergillus nomiae NRRL 13137]KNG85624.1 dimethylallyl tryptophan synthase [Aspergillus nomiae NRRL 13137]
MASVLWRRRTIASGSTRLLQIRHRLSPYTVLKSHISTAIATESKDTTPFANEPYVDSQFWENAVGTALKTLMGGAGYNAASLQEHLNFVSQSVAPALGARPTQGQAPRWKSFMTDDYSPLEYSWSWDGERPTIRYSFEPIGPLAGTEWDPYNRQAPMAYVDQLQRQLPAADWTWFAHFARAFHQDTSAKVATQRDGSSPSSVFIGFDLGRDGRTMCKMYLVPVKAEQTDRSRLAVLDNAVRTLPQFSDLSAYPPLQGFLRHQEEMGTPAHIIGVAVDCVDPSAAKLKIYFRSPSTSFASVKETLTAGGTVSSWDECALEQLQELWSLVLGLPPDFSHNQELPSKSHETSGVLYNFDIKLGNQQPETKVYIPVRHYGPNDHAIAMGLVEFLQRRGGHTPYQDRFLKALEQYASFRSLDQGCGVQTYIACAFKRGQLSLTSYLSAEIYHPGRWEGLRGVNNLEMPRF